MIWGARSSRHLQTTTHKLSHKGETLSPPPTHTCKQAHADERLTGAWSRRLFLQPVALFTHSATWSGQSQRNLPTEIPFPPSSSSNAAAAAAPVWELFQESPPGSPRLIPLKPSAPRCVAHIQVLFQQMPPGSAQALMPGLCT